MRDRTQPFPTSFHVLGKFVISRGRTLLTCAMCGGARIIAFLESNREQVHSSSSDTWSRWGSVSEVLSLGFANCNKHWSVVSWLRLVKGTCLVLRLADSSWLSRTYFVGLHQAKCADASPTARDVWKPSVDQLWKQCFGCSLFFSTSQHIVLALLVWDTSPWCPCPGHAPLCLESGM